MLDDSRSIEIAPSIIASWEVLCYIQKKNIRNITNTKKNAMHVFKYIFSSYRL